MSDNAAGAVYRSHDRTTLDREYDNRSKVGEEEFQAFLRLCSDLSERARASLRCELDVPYGASGAEAMDLFIPDTHGPAPVEVFFHGGYWRMLDKRDFSYVAGGFVPHGRLTAVVNLNDTLRLGEHEVRRNSPFLLEPQLGVPLHLAVGGREGDEYLRQSELLVDAWTTTTCAPHLRVFDEDDHFSIRAQLGDPQSEVVLWMLEQRKPHGG